jgi:hypothetical protein
MGSIVRGLGFLMGRWGGRLGEKVLGSSEIIGEALEVVMIGKVGCLIVSR